MSDSIDRVFVHALNTVKKIPKTGAARPPPADRMRLYGLYKQAMEGDVDGVMERPSAGPGGSEDLVREQDKWDAWNSQKGLSRTEAKRRYVEALVETMHKFANTPNALELVAELEFVWNQVKSNSPSLAESASGPSGLAAGDHRTSGGIITSTVLRRFQPATSGTEGPMKVLSPMSEEDESERRLAELAEQGEDDTGEYVRRNDKRSKRMERAIVRLSAEIAALREQIATGREWRSRREQGVFAWMSWCFWAISKHITADIVVLLLVLLWMRKRKDRRFEDHVRAIMKLAREYVRKFLPAR
ncbi:acyl-CoA binding protein [Trichocladium antarcticum]|uniref:Acyl-CoA binding protein n=1 Tax=Trichocladium antarcticum TaxID=1450529 RepID=A0AAN6UHQ8_9PEZI|nr:acyl-CoA binding protein [Trichocladium antarcticum]